VLLVVVGHQDGEGEAPLFDHQPRAVVRVLLLALRELSMGAGLEAACIITIPLRGMSMREPSVPMETDTALQPLAIILTHT